MEYLYLKVFSLILRSLGLAISSKHLSPRSFTRGLWSVATRRSGQPRVKCLVFSKAQATPRASPSTGEYLVSGPVRNLLPQKVTTQPSGQQSGDIWTHEHVFCSSMNPIPCLLQSVATHVTLDVSNVLTPSLTASNMTSFDL